MLKVFNVLRNKSFYTFLISHMHAYLIERDRLRQENFVDFNGKWDEGVIWIQMALVMIRWSILWGGGESNDISFFIKIWKFLGPAERLWAWQHALCPLRFCLPKADGLNYQHEQNNVSKRKLNTALLIASLTTPCSYQCLRHRATLVIAGWTADRMWKNNNTWHI